MIWRIFGRFWRHLFYVAALFLFVWPFLSGAAYGQVIRAGHIGATVLFVALLVWMLDGEKLPTRRRAREPHEPATCSACGHVKHEKTFQRDRCPRCNRNNIWRP
jgi:uncharacterized paraquat-inducible protein A